MTKREIEMLCELSGCRFAPATFDKRFVRDLSGHPKKKPLTENQKICLAKLHYRYRKQIAVSKL